MATIIQKFYSAFSRRLAQGETLQSRDLSKYLRVLDEVNVKSLDEHTQHLVSQDFHKLAPQILQASHADLGLWSGITGALMTQHCSQLNADQVHQFFHVMRAPLFNQARMQQQEQTRAAFQDQLQRLQQQPLRDAQGLLSQLMRCEVRWRSPTLLSDLSEFLPLSLASLQGNTKSAMLASRKLRKLVTELAEMPSYRLALLASSALPALQVEPVHPLCSKALQEFPSSIMVTHASLYGRIVECIWQSVSSTDAPAVKRLEDISPFLLLHAMASPPAEWETLLLNRLKTMQQVGVRWGSFRGGRRLSYTILAAMMREILRITPREALFPWSVLLQVASLLSPPTVAEIKELHSTRAQLRVLSICCEFAVELAFLIDVVVGHTSKADIDMDDVLAAAKQQLLSLLRLITAFESSIGKTNDGRHDMIRLRLHLRSAVCLPSLIQFDKGANVGWEHANIPPLLFARDSILHDIMALPNAERRRIITERVILKLWIDQPCVDHSTSTPNSSIQQQQQQPSQMLALTNEILDACLARVHTTNSSDMYGFSLLNRLLGALAANQELQRQVAFQFLKQYRQQISGSSGTLFSGLKSKKNEMIMKDETAATVDTAVDAVSSSHEGTGRLQHKEETQQQRRMPLSFVRQLALILTRQHDAAVGMSTEEEARLMNYFWSIVVDELNEARSGLIPSYQLNWYLLDIASGVRRLGREALATSSMWKVAATMWALAAARSRDLVSEMDEVHLLRWLECARSFYEGLSHFLPKSSEVRQAAKHIMELVECISLTLQESQLPVEFSTKPYFALWRFSCLALMKPVPRHRPESFHRSVRTILSDKMFVAAATETEVPLVDSLLVFHFAQDTTRMLVAFLARERRRREKRTLPQRVLRQCHVYFQLAERILRQHLTALQPTAGTAVETRTTAMSAFGRGGDRKKKGRAHCTIAYEMLQAAQLAMFTLSLNQPSLYLRSYEDYGAAVPVEVAVVVRLASLWVAELQSLDVALFTDEGREKIGKDVVHLLERRFLPAPLRAILLQYLRESLNDPALLWLLTMRADLI